MGYVQYFQIPDLKDLQKDSTDVTEEFIPGRIDTIEIFRADTLYVTKIDSVIITGSSPSSNPDSRSYKTFFSDNYISGTVYSEVLGTLESSRVKYFYKREIASTRQIDTKVITVTNNYVKQERLPLFTLNAGILLGASPALDNLYIGPSIGLNTRGGAHLSLSYDLNNDLYFINYKTKLSFPKISLF